MSRLTFSYDSTDVSFNFSTTVNNNGDAEALGMLMNLLSRRINPASAPAPIQTYSVKLTSCGTQKISVIKVIREIASLGLKEAKDVVDMLGEIKSGVLQDEANKIAKLINEAGGSVEILTLTPPG
jgi:ribosomal protein L7/L12